MSPTHRGGVVERVTVVVPCFNEADSLAQLAAGIECLRAALAGRYAATLVLVDDGSTDETWPLLNLHFADSQDTLLVRHERNCGIAGAIATGLARAPSEIVASIDADCTYDPAQLVGMIPLLTDDVDLVLASPYHPCGAVEGVVGWRLALSKTASWMYRCVLRNKLHTYTSCCRVYRKSAVAHLPLSSSRFVGIAELVWRVDRAGGRIVEHPAVLKARTTGQSKMRVVRTGLAHLGLVARATIDRILGGRLQGGQRPPQTSPSGCSEPASFTTATSTSTSSPS